MKTITVIRTFILCTLFSPLLIGCTSTEDNLDMTTQQRSDNLVAELRKHLTSSSNGWHMLYFPSIDKELNTDITENIKTSVNALHPNILARRMGAGGYNLFLRFNTDGSMQFLSDIAYQPTDADNTSALNETYYTTQYNTTVEDAQYDIKIAEDLNLIFTTPTMIDELLGLNVNAGKRFSVVSMSDDLIVLRSANYLDDESERIELRRLDIPVEDWPERIQQFITHKENFRKRSFTTGERKEPRLCVLQISLTATGEVIYQSSGEFGYRLMDDRVNRHSSHNNEEGKRIALYDRKQYELFYRNEQPERTISGFDNSTYYTGLGSGYIATDKGVSFLPGFKFNDEIVFKEFVEMPGKEWVSEVGPYTAKIKFVEQE